MNLSKIQALAFDVGGTVLDWYTGITRDLQAWGEARGITHDWIVFAEEWRRRSLNMALDSRQSELPQGNIDGVHRYVLGKLLDDHGIAGVENAEKDEMALFWHRIPPWPDAPEGHARLRARFILSTITILSVKMVIDVSRLAPFYWDSVISCEMLEWYKFHPSAYSRAAELIGFKPEEIIFVAAHNLDLKAAHDVGFRTALVTRPDEWGEKTSLDDIPDHIESVDFEIDVTAASMTELADKLLD